MGAQKGQKRPRTKQPTEISDWKRQKHTQPLDVPSGNTCLVIRRPIDVFLKMGKIPQPLTDIVRSAIEKNLDDKKAFDISQYEWTPDQLSSVFTLIDEVIVECVVKPKVQPVPEEENPESPKYDAEFERDETLLYVDEVDFNDKSFIFQFVIGGTADAGKFRRELASSVGSVSDGEGSGVSSQ
jgi:hypothetical protein